MLVIASNPGATSDTGKLKNCTLTNASFGCPSTKEYYKGEQNDGYHYCCPCGPGEATREGDLFRIRCHKSHEESEMKPSPSSTIDQPAMENTSPSTTASTTSTFVARPSTTATNPITEAASTPSHNIKNSTQNTTKETTSSGITEETPSQTHIIVIIIIVPILFVLAIVFIVLIRRKKRKKSCCCCCTNSVRDPPGRPSNPAVGNRTGQSGMSPLINDQNRPSAENGMGSQSSPLNPGTRNETQPDGNGSSYHDSTV